ncbi:MAG: hypothetical protein LBQ71_02355 [Hungatella sp.]|nr:hypothetical protein [Hungatella sp.]
MRVENVYPEYKDPLEREKSIQEAYTELQLIFYNKESKKSSSLSKNEQIIDFKKGN